MTHPFHQLRGERLEERVIVAPGSIADRELEALLQRCRDLLLKVSLLPGPSDVLAPAVEVDDVEGIAVVGINPPWLPRSF